VRHTSHHRRERTQLRKPVWSGFLWNPAQQNVANNASGKQWNWAIVPAASLDLNDPDHPFVLPSAPEPRSTLVYSNCAWCHSFDTTDSGGLGYYMAIGLIAWPGNSDKSNADVPADNPPPGPLNNPEAPWIWNNRVTRAIDESGAGSGKSFFSESPFNEAFSARSQRKLPEGYGVLIVAEFFNKTGQTVSSVTTALTRHLLKLP